MRGAERLPRRPPGVPSGEASQRGAAERRPGLCFSLADASWWRHGRGGGNLDEGEGSNQLPRRAAELRRAGVDRGREGQPGWTVFERYRPPLGSLRAVGSNTCVPDRAWAAVTDPVVQVRRARERGATQIGRRRCLCRSSSPVEDTGKLAGAFKTRDGRPASRDARERKLVPRRHRHRKRTVDLWWWIETAITGHSVTGLWIGIGCNVINVQRAHVRRSSLRLPWLVAAANGESQCSLGTPVNTVDHPMTCSRDILAHQLPDTLNANCRFRKWPTVKPT